MSQAGLDGRTGLTSPRSRKRLLQLFRIERRLSDDVIGVCRAVCDIGRVIASNENKISDGWWGGALLQVEGGISMEREERGCQPFAASLG
jgi:hypothetical protein